MPLVWLEATAVLAGGAPRARAPTLPPPSMTWTLPRPCFFTSVASSRKPGLHPIDGQRLAHCLSCKGVWEGENGSFFLCCPRHTLPQ